MADLIVLGTDTEVGKTTFCVLWLGAFSDRYEYWKPVETGDSDSERVAALVRAAWVHAPAVRYRDPVAPGLAAQREKRSVPSAAEIAATCPQPHVAGRGLLIETFGSPLSPLNDRELQVQVVRMLCRPTVLVGSTTVGAIGRALQSLRALTDWAIRPAVVVLVGPPDAYATEQIRRHAPEVAVLGLEPPQRFDSEAVSQAATKQLCALDAIRQQVEGHASRPSLSPPCQGGGRGGPPCAGRAGEVPDSQQLLQRDARAVWHPYTSLRDSDPPLVVVDAEDEFLILADGRRVIDGISSWWTILHGHRHPALMRALAEAAAHYDHVLFAGATHPAAVELAERMLATMPWTGGRVFYSDDGSTAVEVALKMAYQYWCHRDEPQRTLFIGFEGGYHGDTFGAMSVGRDPVFFGRFEPLLFPAEKIPLSARHLADLLARVGQKVAAVIIEPLVQGAGGMRMHSPHQLREIFEVVHDHGALFIADEVMTGGGRTGTLWAHQAAEIAPDLLCAGKTIAGGVLPIAATLVAPHLVEAWATEDRSRTFFHGHSFTAHPLACAVGVANWQLLDGGIGPAPAAMEKFWNERLGPLRGTRGVKDVRIRGTITAVELNVAGGYLADVGRHLRLFCLERGVLLRPLGNVLYTIPPLCTSPSSLEQIATVIHDAVRSVA